MVVSWHVGPSSTICLFSCKKQKTLELTLANVGTSGTQTICDLDFDRKTSYKNREHPWPIGFPHENEYCFFTWRILRPCAVPFFKTYVEHRGINIHIQQIQLNFFLTPYDDTRCGIERWRGVRFDHWKCWFLLPVFFPRRCWMPPGRFYVTTRRSMCVCNHFNLLLPSSGIPTTQNHWDGSCR